MCTFLLDLVWGRATLVLLCSLFPVSATFYIESSTNFSSVDLQQNGL